MGMSETSSIISKLAFADAVPSVTPAVKESDRE